MSYDYERALMGQGRMGMVMGMDAMAWHRAGWETHEIPLHSRRLACFGLDEAGSIQIETGEYARAVLIRSRPNDVCY